MSRRPTGSAPRVGLDDRLARVALSRLAEPGDLRMNTLVTDLGPVAVHEHLTSQRDLHGLLDDVGQRLEALDPERELVQAEERGIRFVVPGDPEWPAGLDDLRSADPLHDRGGVPIGLWVRGPLRLDELAGGVAVVGSRSSTTYGESVARDIAARVSLTGLTAVSGAAFGIDQAAHRGALASGAPTAAVLACGADRSYPAAHSTLLDHIATVGAVVSETAPALPPTRIRFLSRNRLIAALTCGTVVVEAAARSGALNTANWAGRLHRVVMGVPGPVTSAPSQGVHQLLRSGAAALVTGGADVLELVGASGEHLVEEPRGPVRSRDRLSRRDQQVLDGVPVARAAPADSVARAAGLGLLEVQSALSRLHRAGLVEHGEEGWRLAALAHD